ncbi:MULTISPECIES: hypothetical protein [Bradyrhizobium]|uniref:Uncharacterized protein n=1 Tax=Bradyrhizobium elkanii TaxID=29448 RepID=A0A8I2C6F3_BRAEL|nr:MULTISPECIES: hypothetical protein [Bradyrhizobium]MBP1299345.1 hypothetical protein [Bradyrhizobium elkanii]MCP1929799.1 hypothetical protein [Bradyrhizobium elkanii]MCS3481944.1 hypothetical protein [Bradyrhizobium elkanii]MCS3579589.1 hypothetical protein [Bradyrhizobium elkanii]MCS3722460.1 hypothetical protein [Bradyrhizobium elkanii]
MSDYIHSPNHPGRDVFTFGFSSFTGCGPGIGGKSGLKSSRLGWNGAGEVPSGRGGARLPA